MTTFAWLGQTATDEAELDDLSHYLRTRRAPSAAVPASRAGWTEHAAPGALRGAHDGAGEVAASRAAEPRLVSLASVRRISCHCHCWRCHVRAFGWRRCW